MKTKLFILFIALCRIAGAQTPDWQRAQTSDWQWAKNVGGASSDIAGNSMDVDINGNSYITGTFNSPTITFGTTTLTNADNSGSTSDFFIAKYDASGNVIWAKSYGGTSNDISNSICVDTNGNFFITGIHKNHQFYIDTISMFNSYYNNSYDMFTVKFSTDGKAIWANVPFRDWGAAAIESTSICNDANGNVYVTGWFDGNVQFYDGTNAANFHSDYPYENTFIVKFDNDGKVIRGMQDKGSYLNFYPRSSGKSICADTDGNVYVTGYFNGVATIFGSDTLINANGITLGNPEIFVVKYDSTGNALWAKSAWGEEGDRSYGIDVDVNGNSYVTGFFDSPIIIFGNDTLVRTANNYNYFIVKYDDSGNVLWAKSTGGSTNDVVRGTSIKVDANGNAYVSGVFKTLDSSTIITFGTFSFTNNSNYSELFILKYDNSGNELWAKNVVGLTVGNSLYNYYYQQIGACLDDNGNYYISGTYLIPSISFDTTTLTNNGAYDIFIAKLADNTVTGLNPNQVVEDGIIIYPNPSTGKFILDSKITKGEIFIFNALGEKILEQRIQNEKPEIDVSKQPDGIYFISIKNESLRDGDLHGITNKKIILKK